MTVLTALAGPIQGIFPAVLTRLRGQDAPKGALGYEQWVIWKVDKDSNPAHDRLAFRHEWAYAFTEHIQDALDFPIRWQPLSGEGSKTEY